jgi:hypothetical protein
VGDLVTRVRMSGIDGVDGVNVREWWVTPSSPPAPQASDNDQPHEVLLVDRHGKPLITKEPRQVGFRKP